MFLSLTRGFTQRMPIVALFCLSAFISAFILFSVQPFMAKMILPLYGGSPAVWNTAMVFFQAALLAGYAWVHVGLRWFGWRTLSLINLTLFVVSVIWWLPPSVPEMWQPGVIQPAFSVLLLLCLSIGLPFVLVSCNAPLIQYWFSRSSHPNHDDPYFLYAASNLGSLIALLAYPFILEPNLRLGDQAIWWSVGFIALGLLLMVCLLVVWRSRSVKSANVEFKSLVSESSPAASSMLWMLYAAVPSALLLAITNHITTDIAAIPLLWVLPLALYLLTFVVAFSSIARNLNFHLLIRITLVLALLAVALESLVGYSEVLVLIALNLFLLFAAALVCHLRLVAVKPPVHGLTGFYLYMSLGGLLGSSTIAFLAPAVFDSVYEYLLIIVAVLFLMPRIRSLSSRWLLYIMLAAVVLMAVLMWSDAGGAMDPLSVPRILLLIIMMVSMLYFIGRPWLQSLIIAAVLVPSVMGVGKSQDVYAARSFYGAYLVQDGPENLRTLSHGTTIHGAQYIDPSREKIPLAYYHPDYLMGDIVASVHKNRPNGADWAIVGLGTGAMACNASLKDRVTFFEIDPLMVAIASNVELFSYLSKCPPAIEIVEGDARMTLTAEQNASYDFIFLDAFSSDAIPVHVLTHEAMNIYRSKLRADGLLVFHISNRHLDLAPVMAGLASTAGWQAWISSCDVRVGSDLAKSGAKSAIMVAMKQSGDMPQELQSSGCWKSLQMQPVFWSDDYSNLWSVRR